MDALAFLLPPTSGCLFQQCDCSVFPTSKYTNTSFLPIKTNPRRAHSLNVKFEKSRTNTKSSITLPSEASTPESNQGRKEKSLGHLLRPEFPILHQKVNGLPLVYLDSAATSQKPLSVINAMNEYYSKYNANVHRGVHALSARATDEYEASRKKVASFINADSWREIIFTRNASEAINLVANSWASSNLNSGDEIVLTVAEHHSNIVPWQMLAKKKSLTLKFADLDKNGLVDNEQLLSLINDRTKLVAVQHVSNALGSINPVNEIVKKARKHGAKVLLDACQSTPHMKIDVQDLGVDFFAASGHKMCGPTGIGFLYASYELLNSMPPFLGGGEMIQDVYLEYSTYADPPSRFEAGTPPIAEAIGLGAAIDFLTQIGMDKIHDYEVELGTYLFHELSKVSGVKIYGPDPSKGRAALCTFNVDNIHATDLSTILDQQHGIAIRSGHHCTQPLHRSLGTNATARASLYIYNTTEDIDRFILGLKDSIDFFSPFLA